MQRVHAPPPPPAAQTAMVNKEYFGSVAAKELLSRFLPKQRQEDGRVRREQYDAVVAAEGSQRPLV